MVSPIRLSLLLVLLLCSFSLLSQKQANVWYFGNKLGLDFNSGTPVVKKDGAMNSFEGCASICDKNGNLLFYTDGITVWDRTHKVMPHGMGLKGHRSSTQSALIIPLPGDESSFYLFTADEAGYVNPPNDGIHYSVINMCLNKGLGDVVESTKNTFLYKPATERLAATFHANGTDVWLMTHEMATNRYVAYLITEQGLDPTPVISAVGKVHAPDRNYIDEAIGELKFSPDGKRLAVAFQSPADLELSDFDPASGKVTNTFSLRTPGIDLFPYGVCFSPNSQLLYMTCAIVGIYQYNLLAGDAAAIRASLYIQGNGFGNTLSMQNGPDGKIYVMRTLEDTRYIGVIQKPNMQKIDFYYHYHGIDLGAGTYNTALCFPNFISNYADPSPAITYQTYCQSKQVSFDLFKADSVSQVEWNFGDLSPVSVETSPTHTYADTGTYRVTAHLRLKNGAQQSLTKQLHLQAPAFVELGKDTMLCKGESLLLDASAFAGIKQWQDGSTAERFLVTSAGTYWVDVCRNGCSYRDSVKVDYYKPLQVDLGQDRIVCDGKPQLLDVSYPNATYLWQDGSTKATFEVRQSGRYAVIVTSRCETQTDTVQITYEEAPSVYLGEDVSLCIGDTLLLDAYSPFAKTYLWQEMESKQVLSQTAVLSITSAGKYVVEASSENCIVKDTITVTLEECEKNLLVPNVITPNGDGVNDSFEIRGIFSGRWQLVIYNREGKPVYASKNYKSDWSAEGLSPGVYYYHLTDASGKRSYKGWVQVLR